MSGDGRPDGEVTATHPATRWAARWAVPWPVRSSRRAWWWLVAAAAADAARLGLAVGLHRAPTVAGHGLTAAVLAGLLVSAAAAGAVAVGVLVDRRGRATVAADALALGRVTAAAGRLWWPALRHDGPAVAAAAAAALVLTTLTLTLHPAVRGALDRRTAGLLVGLVAARLAGSAAVVTAGRAPTGPARAWVAVGGTLLAVGLTATLAGRTHPAAAGGRTGGAAATAPRWIPLAVVAGVLVGLALHRPPGGVDGRSAALLGAGAALVLLGVVGAVVRGERASAALEGAMSHDPLTGLPGRQLVARHLGASLQAAAGRRRPAAVLLVDVDRFREVNDTRGHAFGDTLLRHLAERLATVAPPGAVVGRTGGDEFAVAVVDVDREDEVMRIADRLLEVFATPLRVGGDELHLTATVGIATNLHAAKARAEDLFRSADTALHRAKVEARGRATVFDDGMRLAVERRVETEARLRTAIDRGELTMHYQPVVDVGTGTLVGFEALMRWAEPNGRLVGPGAFMGVAEDSGLVVRMGAWAILESLQQLRRWIDAGACPRTMGMAVNVAALQLRDPGLPTTVMGALRATALPPHQLTLEITETALLSETRDVERTIDRLKALGVQLALDDFGTGHSSLAHLRRFPIDRIKVDRSFVGNLETSAEDRALVRTIVAMARELHKDVVAEGVETEGQLRVLADMGCAKAQGYLFSRAVPGAAVLAGLALGPGRNGSVTVS